MWWCNWIWAQMMIGIVWAALGKWLFHVFMFISHTLIVFITSTVYNSTMYHPNSVRHDDVIGPKRWSASFAPYRYVFFYMSLCLLMKHLLFLFLVQLKQHTYPFYHGPPQTRTPKWQLTTQHSDSMMSQWHNWAETMLNIVQALFVLVFYVFIVPC